VFLLSGHAVGGGCSAVSSSCKRDGSGRRSPLLLRKLRAESSIVLSCNVVGAAGAAYPSNLNLPLSWLEGYGATMLACIGRVWSSALTPSLVASEVLRGRSYGEIAFSSIGSRPLVPGDAVYTVLGDPLQRLVRPNQRHVPSVHRLASRLESLLDFSKGQPIGLRFASQQSSGCFTTAGTDIELLRQRLPLDWRKVPPVAPNASHREQDRRIEKISLVQAIGQYLLAPSPGISDFLQSGLRPDEPKRLRTRCSTCAQALVQQLWTPVTANSGARDSRIVEMCELCGVIRDYPAHSGRLTITGVSAAPLGGRITVTFGLTARSAIDAEVAGALINKSTGTPSHLALEKAHTERPASLSLHVPNWRPDACRLVLFGVSADGAVTLAARVVHLSPPYRRERSRVALGAEPSVASDALVSSTRSVGDVGYLEQIQPTGRD
jgi:hypothetical protein